MQASAAQPTLATYPVQMPSRCCNCGRPRDVAPLETKWKKTQSAIYVKVVSTAALNFPYCERCAPSAERPAPDRSDKATFALIAGAVVVWATGGVGGGDVMEVSDVPLVLGLVAGFVVYGVMTAWAAGHKLLPGQTSYYQPVRLVGFKQKFTGKVIGLKLGFTSSVYEREFREANPLAYQAGLLESQVLTKK